MLEIEFTLMAIKDTHYVVDYTHIDDYRGLRPLSEAVDDGFSHASNEELGRAEDQLLAELTALFKESGWEGDGEIECYFLPPCFSQRDDGWTDIIFHVKQNNNGTSWLAIPKSLVLKLPSGFLAESPYA